MKARICDDSQRDSKYYTSQGRLFNSLTDERRTEAIRELYDMYLCFQMTKSPDQIKREKGAFAVLNVRRIARKYVEALEHAFKNRRFFFES